MPSQDTQSLSQGQEQRCHTTERPPSSSASKETAPKGPSDSLAPPNSQSRSRSSSEANATRRLSQGLRTSVLISQILNDDMKDSLFHEREESRSSSDSTSFQTSGSSVEIISVAEDLSGFLSGRRSVTPAALESREGSLAPADNNEQAEPATTDGGDSSPFIPSDAEFGVRTAPIAQSSPLFEAQSHRRGVSSSTSPMRSDTISAPTSSTDNKTHTSGMHLNAASSETHAKTAFSDATNKHANAASRDGLKVGLTVSSHSTANQSYSYSGSNASNPTSKSPAADTCISSPLNAAPVSPQDSVVPNVYINGLPPNFPDESLYVMTREFGNVVSVRTFTRHVGDRLSGYGFVLFEYLADAQRCIEALKKYRNLHPSFSKQVHKIPGTSFSESPSGSLSSFPTSSSISSDVSWRAPVALSSSSTLANLSSAHSFSDLDMQKQDNAEYESYQKKSETLTFKEKMEKLADPRSTNLYIEGLPLSIDEMSLAALVAPYRVMSSRFFPTKLSDPPRIIAFVRLETRTGALAIIERLNGRVVRGWEDNGSKISVRFADTPEQRDLRRQELLSRGEEDESTGGNRITMAQAALLNMRGVEMQLQTASRKSLSGTHGQDYSTSYKSNHNPHSIKAGVRTFANGNGGGLLGGSKSESTNEQAALSQLPIHPLLAGLYSDESTKERSMTSAPVMDFQKYLGGHNQTHLSNPLLNQNLGHLMAQAMSLSDSNISVPHAASSTSFRDIQTPLSPLQLQQATHGATTLGHVQNLSVAELALLQQQLKLQIQQQELAAKLASASNMSSGAFSQLQAQSLLRSPAMQMPATTPAQNSQLDAFAKLRERVRAQQYQQPQQSGQSQVAAESEHQHTTHRKQDYTTITSPNPQSTLSSGRNGAATRTGDLRQHILVNNQQQALSTGRTSGDKASSLQQNGHGQQQLSPTKRSHAYITPEQRLDTKNIGRRSDDEKSDGTPFVSPALTYASRTPSTLSPSTPLFETFTPPQQSTSVHSPDINRRSPSISMRRVPDSQLSKAPISVEGNHAVDVSASNHSQTTTTNAGGAANQRSEDGRH